MILGANPALSGGNGSFGELILSVLDQCGGTTLACDLSQDLPNRHSALTLDAMASTTYVIMVDSEFDSVAGP